MFVETCIFVVVFIGFTVFKIVAPMTFPENSGEFKILGAVIDKLWNDHT
jgi:hypothetical protein